MQTIGCVALVVRDYDEAIAFFTERLRFELVEDTPLGNGKRWVLVAPAGIAGTALLLARAKGSEQTTRVGNQTGGRVFLFLRTDDCRRDYREMRARGVEFEQEPRDEEYGTVAVFRDLYGNRWDLVQPVTGEDLGSRHQFHGVQPVLPARDVARSAAYFRDVLGFEIDFLEGDPPVHGRIRKGDGSYGQPVYVHLSQAEPAAVRPCGELRIHVGHDLDGLFEAYRARGVDVVFAPVSQPWGLREFAVREIDGHVLRFCAEA
jgi:lactoylglutathione lyase